jgi:dolichyl-phosphate beta-glucosyltransferase
VPSYNEQERLPIMMEETLNYLTAKKKKDPSFTYEIIVVDDGSRDKTSQVALEFSRKHGSDVIRVMTLTKNVGKGGAVQQVSASIFAQFNVIFGF